MKKVLPVILACLTLALSGCASYTVHESDETVQQVMKRWAAEHDRQLLWEVDDLRIVDREGLNKAVRSATSLKEASLVFMTVVETGRKQLAKQERRDPPPPVQVCIDPRTVRVMEHRWPQLPCSQ